MRRPRFWFAPPQAPGWRAQGLRALRPLWPRPPPLPGPVPDVAFVMPVRNALIHALALVHLTQGWRGKLTAHVPSNISQEGFDMALFLADFLPLSQTPVSGATLLSAAVSPVNAQVRVLLIDASVGFGNGLCRPAGPLRHSPRDLCEWADICLLIGSEAQHAAFLEIAVQMGWALPPVHMAEIRALQMGMDWAGAAILPFSAGEFADLLFQACRSEGAILRGAITLPRGQIPSVTLLRRLLADATRLGAQLVTTEADAQTLPADFRRHLLVMPLRLRGAEGLAAAVLKLLPSSVQASCPPGDA